jgi:hypothetical protein
LERLLTVAPVEDAGPPYHHGRLPDGAVEFIEGRIACFASPESKGEREFYETAFAGSSGGMLPPNSILAPPRWRIKEEPLGTAEARQVCDVD